MALLALILFFQRLPPLVGARVALKLTARQADQAAAAATGVVAHILGERATLQVRRQCRGMQAAKDLALMLAVAPVGAHLL
jgi:hypothetical protein